MHTKSVKCSVARTIDIMKQRSKWCMLVAGFTSILLAHICCNHCASTQSNREEVQLNNTEKQLISKPPNIVLLEDILDESAGLNNKFRTLLLDDDTGNRLNAIEESERGQVKRVNREVFRQWLDGRGAIPVTWRTIIDLLFKSKLNRVAEVMNRSINVTVLDDAAPLYAHSEAYFNFLNGLKSYYQELHTIKVTLLHGASTVPFLNVSFKDSLNGSFVNLSVILGELGSNSHKRLLITGKPGSGKTTLMTHLAKEWANGNILPSCLLLFLINLQPLNTLQVQSVSALLELFPYNGGGNLQIMISEANRKNQAGVCLLFDGYDELLTQDADNFIFDTFFNTQRYIFILASRPYDFLKDTMIKRIDIVGYEQQNLHSHLDVLLNVMETEPNDKLKVKQSIQRLWNEHPEVQELCSLPMHLTMMIFIARSQLVEAHDFELNTRTQIYTAFINSTIKHYRRWKTDELWRCMDTSHTGDVQSNFDNLCDAFKELQTAAFSMLFENKTMFHENPNIQKIVKSLGFVKVKKIQSTKEQVMYTFSHATILEYFSALHLTRLSQEEQLYYITLYPQPQSLWSFFFGLLNDFYSNYPTERIPLLLRRMSAHYHRKLSLRHDPCEFEIDIDFFDTVREIMHTEQELQDKLLQLTDVIVNSTLCVYSDIYKNHSVFKNLNIHVFKYRAGSLESFVQLDGQRYSLNEQYTKFQLCFEDSKWCSAVPGVTHFRANVYDHNHIKRLDCMLKAFTNLVSIDIQIYSDTRQYYQATAQVLQKLDHLEVINILPLNCIQLSMVIRDLGESQPSFNSLTIIAKKFRVYKDKRYTVSGITEQLTYWAMYLLFPEWGSQMQIWTDIETNTICHTSSLAKRLNNPDKLQSLKIKGTGLFEEYNSYVDLSTYIDGFQSVKFLYFTEVDIMKSKLNKFLTNKNKTHHLLTLEISRTNLNDLGLKKLSENMPTNLQELILYSTNLTDIGIASLANALKNMHNLQSLQLSGNNITGNGVELLVEALMPHNHLRSLDLSYNWHIMENKTAFLALAQLTNLRQLNVGRCKLDAETLTEVLKNFTRLESLALCKNSGQRLSDDKNIRHLVPHMAHLTEVKHIAFWNCPGH